MEFKLAGKKSGSFPSKNDKVTNKSSIMLLLDSLHSNFVLYGYLKPYQKSNRTKRCLFGTVL